jgi:hypothetical protein
MKNLRFLIYSAITSAILFSCQKSIPDIVNGSAVTGNFRAKINGTQWIANASASAIINGGVINISGSGNHKFLNIILVGSAAGTYVLSDSTFNTATYIDSNNSTAAYTTQAASIVAGGQVTVTSIDNVAKTISGTFAFKTFRSGDSSKAEFTEGIFEKLKFNSPATGPGSGNDTFHVKIDSTDFVATTISAVETSGIISVTGVGSGNKIVSLQIPSGITPGPYLIGGAIVNGIYTVGGTQLFMATTGTFTVLEHNTTTKRLRANFSFTAMDALGTSSANFTQGYLSVVHN